MREPIYQVVMVATVGETQDIKEKFPHVKITRSSPYSADIISADQSKLKGIAHLGKVLISNSVRLWPLGIRKMT